MIFCIRAVMLLGLCFAMQAAHFAAAVEVVTHGRFGDVSVYRGRGTIRSVVLFISGREGWTPAVDQLAQHLAEPGTLVVGIDSGHYLVELEKAAEACVSPSADLESLSHFVQAELDIKKYLEPTLLGYAAGATLAYAALADAPERLFKGMVTLSFCPELELAKPLCTESGMKTQPRLSASGSVVGSTLRPVKELPGRWIALQGQRDTVCPVPATRQFVAAVSQADLELLPKGVHDLNVDAGWTVATQTAVARLSAAAPTPSRSTALPAPVADLPLVIVPSTQAGPGTWFGVLLSGDGGWEGLDKGLSQELAKHDIPIVGWNSLKYFWYRRTAAGASKDLDRVIREYAHRWGRSHVLLIGFSQGADTMPFMYNRLPPKTHELVGYTALLGISDNALWEFHVATWLGRAPKGIPTAPELEHWSGSPYLCLYGEADPDAACAQLTGHDGTVLKLRGGHHMGNAYAKIADAIMSRLPPL